MTFSPGATLGILGNGQLGRMCAQAAHTMGYKVIALGPVSYTHLTLPTRLLV